MAHDANTKIDKQVQFEYELDSIDLDIGKHVKVTTADTGGWKLFMKTATGWDNVGTENGTIKLSTKLNSNFTYRNCDIIRGVEIEYTSSLSNKYNKVRQ